MLKRFRGAYVSEITPLAAAAAHTGRPSVDRARRQILLAKLASAVRARPTADQVDPQTAAELTRCIDAALRRAIDQGG